MYIMSWVKQAYFKKIYNLITLTIPIDELIDYTIMDMRIKNGNLNIIFKKK